MSININQTNNLARGLAEQPACEASDRCLTTSVGPAQLNFSANQENAEISNTIQQEKFFFQNSRIHNIVFTEVQHLPLTPGDLLRFYERYVPDPNSGCWIWTALWNYLGYGIFAIGPKNYRAHRISFEIFKGSFSRELDVCHKCDTPACVNPDHLFLGSAKDNIQDAVRKGRWTVSNFTPAQVLAIRKDTRKLQEIADAYGVGLTSIFSIKRGESYQWVDDKSKYVTPNYTVIPNAYKEQFEKIEQEYYSFRTKSAV